FNSPHGACTGCQGLGATYDFDPRLVVPDESKSLLDGAIAPWAKGDKKLVREAIQGLAKTYGFDPAVAFGKLSKKHRDLILLGPGAAKRASTVADEDGPVVADEEEVDPEFSMPRARRPSNGEVPSGRSFEGVIPNLRRRYEEGPWSVQ